MTFDFDLFVIGAGSGGIRASRMASNDGKKVAVAEDEILGGTCVNVGCVPKKLFTYAGAFSHSFKNCEGFGWKIEEKPKFDWETLLKNKNTEIKRLNDIYKNMLINSGVEIINGRAKITGKNSVEVAGKTYTAERILIAAGSTPSMPNIEGIEHAGTSFDAFYMKIFPKKVLIVGGGYIAVEFASIFNNLGADTSLILRQEHILREFDNDISNFTKQQLETNGIKFENNTSFVKLEKDGDKTLCTTKDSRVIEANFVMYATGRKPFIDGLNLESVDIETKDGAIVVNEDFQTNVPSIYALGDVINRMQLTPIALGEAMIFFNRVYGDKSKIMSYENVPTAVFCDPSVGTCGLTQEQAEEQGYDIDIYKSEFRPMKNTLSGNPARCLMKLVLDKKTDVVLGAHMVGDDAGEIMQGIGIALKAKLTKADFDVTIGIHPSSAEEFVTMRTPCN